MVEQRTFGDITGNDPTEPVKAMGGDIVVCVDGSEVVRSDTLADCVGGFHIDEEDRQGVDVMVITDLINSIGKAADAYATENTDYSEPWDFCVKELSHDWAGYVKDWLSVKYGKYSMVGDHTIYDDCIDKLVEHICENLEGASDCDVEYNPSDYAAYSGKGCCLLSVKIEEEETQIEVAGYPALQALHENGRLDDVLDDVDCDPHVSRNRNRVKNEKTGDYEPAGRFTYGSDDDHPTFEIHTMPGGGWDYIVSEGSMNERFTAAIVGYCKTTDKS